MMPAAKHGDPQIGVDIHLCTVPPSPSPVPLPTPHTSVVFDPFDYVPILGATVTVCGMKRATAGTSATAIHIPPGFPFAPKLPDKDDEIFMGSSTVVADGDPFSFTSVPTLSCQVAGMPSPPRLKKKGPPKAMLLPTTLNLAIPTNVFVGGPPTISLMGTAFKTGFAAIGRFARSGLFKRFRQWLFKGLDPGFLKCVILRAEPVNILSGEVAVDHEDFTLPGRIPIQWQRTYSSGTCREGACGYGWETPADIRIEVDATDGSVCLVKPGSSLLFFQRLPAGQGEEAAELELMDGALLSDYGDTFQVRTKEDRVYHFVKSEVGINPAGNVEYPLTRITDLCGNWLAFERCKGHVHAIDESAGRRIEFTTKDGRIMAATLSLPGSDQRHTFVRYEYDGSGNLVTVIDAMGAPYTFAYDQHHMVRHTDRKGLSFYYEYEIKNRDEWRVVHAWGDGGLYDYTFEYFDDLNERRITNSLGHVSIVQLNEAGLPISEIDPLGGMMIFEYDDCGRTTAVVDQDQHRTTYTYDGHGNLLKLTRPDGQCIATEFNPDNKAVKITDPNGAVWHQAWNVHGLLVSQVTPLGAESVYQYDAFGQLIGFNNPRGALTRLSFDGYGNLTRIVDALGHITTFAYDILGQVISKTDPLGQKTSYGYDCKGRLRTISMPSGATIICEYDVEDNLIQYVDENGAKTRLEYCGLGEIKRRLQPDGHSVEYHYDTEERLIGVTNQRGERYQLIRDPLGHIVEEIDYWGQARRYAYSNTGHLRQTIDPLDRVIQYQTDPLGWITQKLMPNPFNSDQVQSETFEYDASGNLTACENSAIRIQRTFDAEGRLIRECQGQAAIITNTYDANGNRLTRSIDLNIEKRQYTNTIHYEYDQLDQAVGIKIKGHPPILFQRNALGQVIRERLSENLQRDLAYSPDGYLIAQQVAARDGPLFEQSYHYDLAGNIIEKRDSVLGMDQFSYDPIGRLVAHLDPQGRLKKYLNDPAGDRLQTRAYPQDRNGHTEWRREGAYEGISYRFDRSGNLVWRKGVERETHLRWDANQRLVESATNGQRTRYQYDPLGRRISKTTGSLITCFFWDADALAGEVSEVPAEYADNNVDQTMDKAWQGRSQQREYVYYPLTFEPLALIDSGSSSRYYHYHNEPNGSPTRLTDDAGNIVWSATYDGMGRVEQILADQVDQSLRMQGQYYDPELDLCYNRYRYFDPLTCSFISQDPLGLAGGENVYAYGPNIWAWIDPSGLSNFIFRGDDFHSIGDPIGLPLGSDADITNPLDHVKRQSKGETSIYTSFSEERKKASAFSKKGKNVFKVNQNEIKILQNEGQVKIITADNVSDEMKKMGFSKKEIKETKANMMRNREVLIEGQIPGNSLKKVKC